MLFIYCNQRCCQESIRRKLMMPRASVPFIYVALGFCKKGISRMKCRKRNEAQDRQQTQDSISSTALCDTRSRRWKSWEMQQIQTGTKDAENSWFCKQQYAFMQTTFAWLQVARNTENAMCHERCSKLTMLPSSVRISATNGRLRYAENPWSHQQQYRIFMLPSDSAKKEKRYK